MADPKLLKEIKQRAHVFNSVDDLHPLVSELKDKKVVMLGEATHGTKDFYEWRYLITKELIEKHGFNFIAVEGDWPPCIEVNSFIRGNSLKTSAEVLSNFKRWPTWMWANTETIELIEWLQNFNTKNIEKVGFYGLDVYSLFESIDKINEIVQKIEPSISQQVKSYFSCFDPYHKNEMNYAKSLLTYSEGCSSAVLAALKDLLDIRLKSKSDQEIVFNVQQNARIIKNAERFYRAMVFGDENSWNVRDQHMMDTLKILHKYSGPDSKSIVWEHNTHIGDYKATDMVVSGQVNIGGLAREEFGHDNVSLVGFGTYKGSVIASHAWDGPIEVMKVPRGRIGSIESEFHSAVLSIGAPNYYIIMDKEAKSSPLSEMRGHRAIGVVYHPEWEHRGNYVPTSLANRYDAFIYIDQTEALTPLDIDFNRSKIPETYPSGDRA